MLRSGVLILPAQTAAILLVGDPPECEVEGVADRHGDEDYQDRPGEARRDPE